MKLSLNWIQQYLNLSDVSPEDLVKRLTLATCEVEEMYPVFAQLGQLIIARVDDCHRHPDADKLSVCKVTEGSKTFTVVCGAPNVRKGIHVLFAPVGAVVGDPENPLKIEKRKIRGVESSGMICAASEVGLELVFPDREGILILDQEDLDWDGPRKPEQFLGKAASALMPMVDTVLDIDNKSITHRPDLWCHFGFAREIAAIYGKEIQFDPLSMKPPSASKGVPRIDISIKNKAALGYSGLSADGIKVGPSPLWLRGRLASVGQKSINNIVDVSNYVMLELAQPNHAFDREKLKGNAITVDRSKGKLSVDTLDGEKTAIPEDSILILDSKEKPRPVAVGGIIGGESTAISESTGSIFLESATFPRELIRFSLSKMQIRTDSAVRFEKGQDPAKMIPALHRLASLIKEVCPQARFGRASSAGDTKGKRNRIKLSLAYLQQRLGFAISAAKVESTLRALQFDLTIKGNTAGSGSENKSKSAKKSKKKAPVKADLGPKSIHFDITAPTFRSQYDISIPEDIVEELGRIYGYDNIQPSSPAPALQALPENQARNLEKHTKQLLSSYGFYETMGYSFCSEKDNLPYGSAGLQILNPVHSLQSRMRLSQNPGLIRQAALNQDRFDSVRLFELGRVFHPPAKVSKQDFESNLPTEVNRLGVLSIPDELSAGIKPFDEFLDLRALLQRWLKSLDLTFRIQVPETAQFNLHPGFQIEFQLLRETTTNAPHRNPEQTSGLDRGTESTWETLGFGGLLHPGYAGSFELKRPAILFDLNFDSVLAESQKRKSQSAYSPPGNQPDSIFEITVVLEKEESTARVVEEIRKLALPDVASVSLKTIYTGAPLDESQMAVSYRIRASRKNHTLTGKESQKVLEQIVQKLEGTGISLRS
jgi:phenylalanyl-tRNA synthetase beta chain